MSFRIPRQAKFTILALGLATAASAQSVITQPDWLRRPSGEDMAHVYPEIDQALGLEGRAIASCDVSAAGLLENCVVVTEAPTGLGFGAAALALTPTFRMRPQTRDGQPVAGGTVRIPITFKLPQDPKASIPAAKPVDAAKLALGRDFVDGMGAVAKVREAFDAEADSIVEAKSPGVAAEDAAAAAEALRASAAAQAPAFRDAFARAAAETLDQPDLAALAAVSGSPGGALWLPTPEREVLEEALNAEFWRRLGPAARTAFCVERRCEIEGEAFGPSAQDPIWEPVWADEPSTETIAHAAPLIARLVNVAARVKLRCRVTRLGILEECQTAAEVPAGLGFRAVAIRLSQAYRLSPTQAAAGASGQLLPLEFVFPALEPQASYVPGKAPSAKARAAAEAYLDAADIDPQAVVEHSVGDALAKPPEGADPIVFAQAVAAVRKAVSQATAETRAMRADAYARMYTVEQLNSAAAFVRSPAGATMRSKGAELEGRLMNAVAPVGEAVLRDARNAYCKGRPCGAAQSSDASSAPSTRTP